MLSPTLVKIDVPRRRILRTLTAEDAEAIRLHAGSYNGFSLFDVSAIQLKKAAYLPCFNFSGSIVRIRRPRPLVRRKNAFFRQCGWSGPKGRSRCRSHHRHAGRQTQPGTDVPHKQWASRDRARRLYNVGKRGWNPRILFKM